jgi:hypothetical protein
MRSPIRPAIPLRALPAALSLLTACGCLSSSTLVRVAPDGSGTVVVSTVMGAEARAQLATLRSMAMPREGGGDEPGELFSVAQAQARAQRMGDGVRFLSSRKLEGPEGEGLEAVYAFDDVRTLRISERPEPPVSGGGAVGAREGTAPLSFRMEPLPNGHTRLTVVMPPPPPDPADPPPSLATPPSPAVSRLRTVLKGLRVSLAVEVPHLVATSSPFVEGSRVTLLDMDFERLLADDERLEELALKRSRSLQDAKRILKDAPGFKVVSDAEVTIEFAAR